MDFSPFWGSSLTDKRHILLLGNTDKVNFTSFPFLGRTCFDPGAVEKTQQVGQHVPLPLRDLQESRHPIRSDFTVHYCRRHSQGLEHHL